MKNTLLTFSMIFLIGLGLAWGQDSTKVALSETQEIAVDTIADSVAAKPAGPLSKDEQKVAEWEAKAARAEAEAATLSEKAKSSPDPEAYHEVTKASLNQQKYQKKADLIKAKIRLADYKEQLKQQRADKKAQKKNATDQ